MLSFRALGRRLAGQEGYALVVSMVVTSLMLGAGVATLSYVDSEQRHSGIQRHREAAFNLAQGAHSAEIFILSRDWPGTSGESLPSECTPTVVHDKCPSAGTVANAFSATDYVTGSGFIWNVRVRDNGGSAKNFYNEALVANQPTWDSDGDDAVWVRAQASTQGRTRTLVALVKAEKTTVDFPRAPFIAGAFATSNSGNKIIVHSGNKDSYVRCGVAVPPCQDFRPGQVTGNVLPSFDGSVIAPEKIEALKQTAQTHGTYYANCPANPNGKVVFVESGTCTYNNSCCTQINSQASPGIFIVANGRFVLDGNTKFYGVVYGLNHQIALETDPAVVTVTGTAEVHGAVFVDGRGLLVGGSSKDNIFYDDLAFAELKAYGTAGIIQNTWRELPGPAS